MRTEYSLRSKLFFLLILGYSLIILLLDYISPLGVATGALYIMVCIASSFVLTSKQHLYWITIGCCALIILGYYISPETKYPGIALLNRLLSLFIVLVGCIMGAIFMTVRMQERALDRQFKLAMEHAPNAIAMVDSDGTIILANKQMEELFGWSVKDLMGKNIDMLVPEEIRSAHSAYRERFLRERKPRAMGEGSELYGIRKDGSGVPIEIGLTPIDAPQGKRVVSSIVDLTERHKAEQELRDVNQQLQHKNLELEQFVYTVSHDLKAPLVTIGGFARKLGQQPSLQGNADISRYLDRITANVHKMELLIRDLLDLSRVSHRELEITQVDLNQCLQQSLEVLDNQLNAVAGRVQVLDQLPYVQGQENLLFQIFNNLIGNAIKYHREGVPPEITIGLRERLEDHFTFYIADNGPGIQEEYYGKVFEIFERLEPDRCEGTGVGLAIVKKITEKHAGEIWLESNPNGGSIFFVRLPGGLENGPSQETQEQQYANIAN